MMELFLKAFATVIVLVLVQRYVHWKSEARRLREALSSDADSRLVEHLAADTMRILYDAPREHGPGYSHQIKGPGVKVYYGRDDGTDLRKAFLRMEVMVDAVRQLERSV
jgi:hypothetical protein